MPKTLNRQHMTGQLGPSSAYDANEDGSGVIVSKHLQPGAQAHVEPSPEPGNSPVPPVEPPAPIEKTDPSENPDKNPDKNLAKDPAPVPEEKATEKNGSHEDARQAEGAPDPGPEVLDTLLRSQKAIQQKVEELAQSKQKDRIAEAEMAVANAGALMNDVFETGTPEEFAAAQKAYREAVENEARVKLEASQPAPATAWYANEQTAASELTKWVETSPYVKDQPYRQERAVQIARFVKPENFPTPEAYFEEVEAQTRKALGEADATPPQSKNTPAGLNQVNRVNTATEPKAVEIKSVRDLPKDMQEAVAQFMDFLPQGVTPKEYEEYVLNVVKNNEAVRGRMS